MVTTRDICVNMCAQSEGSGEGMALEPGVCKNAEQYAFQRLEEEGEPMRAKDLAEEYECTNGHMRRALNNLRDAGKVRRVRRGLYALTSGEENGESSEMNVADLSDARKSEPYMSDDDDRNSSEESAGSESAETTTDGQDAGEEEAVEPAAEPGPEESAAETEADLSASEREPYEQATQSEAVQAAQPVVIEPARETEPVGAISQQRLANFSEETEAVESVVEPEPVEPVAETEAAEPVVQNDRDRWVIQLTLAQYAQLVSDGVEAEAETDKTDETDEISSESDGPPTVGIPRSLILIVVVLWAGAVLWSLRKHRREEQQQSQQQAQQQVQQQNDRGILPERYSGLVR